MEFGYNNNCFTNFGETKTIFQNKIILKEPKRDHIRMLNGTYSTIISRYYFKNLLKTYRAYIYSCKYFYHRNLKFVTQT